MQTSVPPTFAESEFRKASRSDPDKACVRVARRDGWVEIRDDKADFGAADDHRLLLSAAAFDTDLHAWRTGAPATTVELLPRPDGDTTMRLAASVGPELVFTRAEINAFRHGVTHHEFDAPTAQPTAR